MDTLQAAVLNAKLPHLSDWNEDRRSAAQRYSDALENTPLVLPETADYNEHVFYVYVVQAESQDQRDALRAHLEEDGIGTGIHYPVPVHKQPSYQSLDADFSTLAVTEGAATRILSIPMYPELGAEEIEYIADSVRTFYNLD